MLKQITVAVCDICGATEPAKVFTDCRNDLQCTVPAGWKNAKGNSAVHLCPTCARKLGPDWGERRG